MILSRIAQRQLIPTAHSHVCCTTEGDRRSEQKVPNRIAHVSPLCYLGKMRTQIRDFHEWDVLV